MKTSDFIADLTLVSRVMIGYDVFYFGQFSGLEEAAIADRGVMGYALYL